MLRSMTGFGRCEISDNNRKITVEMKSVNHRYLDINIRLPKKLYFFESEIRNIIKGVLERGKVDVFISYEDLSEGSTCLKYNEALAKEYFDTVSKIAEGFGVHNDASATYIARCPEVVIMEEQPVDEEELEKLVTEAMKGALEEMVKVREREGENLRNNLLNKTENLQKIVAFIEERSPQILTEYRAKLDLKVKELLENAAIDENRVAAEVTLFADKVCIDEEIVRLGSHISNMNENLKKGDRVGRKLDFIAQEMNREANTILSKTSDMDITNMGIELKNTIEEIREQVQNIE
ncbi:MAG: YicC family protein [Lachnospiraceae bacterium]|nr:YicC family protein [Lachnospiraceae bacterium]